MIDIELIKTEYLEYVLIAMAVFILYLLYYVFSKDTKTHKDLHSIASVVEDLNKEIFYLKRDLQDSKNSFKGNVNHMNDEEIYQEIERTVYDMVKPLSIGLKRVEDKLITIDEDINIRISSLENGVKQISIPVSVHGNDDSKIISLYKQGVSLDTISKELHISKPEVEFVLKINKIS